MGTSAPGVDVTLYDRIRELIIAAHKTVARGIDLVQVWTNFEIGRHIFEHEQKGKDRAFYGKEIIKSLAKKLSSEFGRGFSKSNLEYMRRFYLAYRERVQITQFNAGQSEACLGDKTVIAQFQTGQLVTPVSKHQLFCLSWTHYVFLLGVSNSDERNFYEIETASQGWNLEELRRQFDSGLYERLALSRDKEGIRRLAQEGQIVSQPKDLLKEPLVLEFLGLSEQVRYSESENATIGIILCKKKHETLVEITLPKGANIHAKEYQLYLPSKKVLQNKLIEWAKAVHNG